MPAGNWVAVCKNLEFASKHSAFNETHETIPETLENRIYGEFDNLNYKNRVLRVIKKSVFKNTPRIQP